MLISLLHTYYRLKANWFGKSKPKVTLEILYFKLFMREHRLERFQNMHKTYPEAMKEHIGSLIVEEEKLVKEAKDLLETYLSNYKKFVRSIHKDPENPENT